MYRIETITDLQNTFAPAREFLANVERYKVDNDIQPGTEEYGYDDVHLHYDEEQKCYDLDGSTFYFADDSLELLFNSFLGKEYNCKNLDGTNSFGFTNHPEDIDYFIEKFDAYVKSLNNLV